MADNIHKSWRPASEVNKREYPKPVTRYVLTYVNKDGMRTLVGPQQGRCTYATPEEAEKHLADLRANNSPERLREFFGVPDKMEVRPCDCWPVHFDPVGIYFD
jgi:hypothetical protein